MDFCPKCGKKGTNGALCSRCSLETGFLEHKDIIIKVCIACRSYLFRNRWLKFSTIENAVKKAVEASLKRKMRAEINPILPEIQFKPGLNHDFEVELKVSAAEKYFIPARLELTTCPNCSKRGTQYFEGILQLRNPSQEVIDFIRKEAKKNKDKGVHITNEEKVAYGKGIDFYFTSQKYIQNLGQKLQKTFGGILKINPRLFSRNRQTSRDVYRINVLFELLDFKIGDVVAVDGKVIRVTEVGKTAIGYDLAADKKTNFEYKKKDYDVLEKKKTTVVKVYPHIEVLDPETYQDMKAENKKEVKAGEEVEIVVFKGKCYLV